MVLLLRQQYLLHSRLGQHGRKKYCLVAALTVWTAQSETMQRYPQTAALLLLLCCVFKGALAQDAPADSAEESDSGEDTTYWIYVHGILMSLGWVGLLPREHELLQSVLLDSQLITCTHNQQLSTV